MSRDGLEYEDVYGEFVYDEDGDWVECDSCHTNLIWKDGQYYCPTCQEYWTRKDFFDYIGAELPGDECLTCDNLYPGCIVCPYGYEDEDDYDDDDDDDDDE